MVLSQRHVACMIPWFGLYGGLMVSVTGLNPGVSMGFSTWCMRSCRSVPMGSDASAVVWYHLRFLVFHRP